MLRVSMALACSAFLVSSIPAAAADSPKTVTFTKDVAPIFQEKCESCHRPDNMAPMSLLTYEEARPWAKSIAARVGARQMPPWHIDKTVGIQKFKNDRSLSDEQIDTIVQWVAAGAPKGDPKDMPPPKVWADESGWHARQQVRPPDLIVKSPEYTMSAGRAGRLVAADRADRPHRAALGARDRHPSRRQERAEDHASRARPPHAAGRHGRRRSSPTTRTSPATASSWNGRSARTATRCVPTPAA